MDGFYIYYKVLFRVCLMYLKVTWKSKTVVHGQEHRPNECLLMHVSQSLWQGSDQTQKQSQPYSGIHSNTPSPALPRTDKELEQKQTAHTAGGKVRKECERIQRSPLPD